MIACTVNSAVFVITVRGRRSWGLMQCWDQILYCCYHSWWI